MNPPAMRNAKNHDAWSFVRHVATTVPLMTRLTSAPKSPISTAALRVRLLPNVSGMTATLVRPNTTLAVFTITMSSTRGQ